MNNINITEVVFGDSLCHEIKISEFLKNNTMILVVHIH